MIDTTPYGDIPVPDLVTLAATRGLPTPLVVDQAQLKDRLIEALEAQDRDRAAEGAS